MCGGTGSLTGREARQNLQRLLAGQVLEIDLAPFTLTVDVLTLDGSTVLTDVISGADLSSHDLASYPALKLRANLSSTVAGETPALDTWRLAWEVMEHKVYLPLIGDSD
jgi:hypothetical protein